jgi:hypothetical protein
VLVSKESRGGGKSPFRLEFKARLEGVEVRAKLLETPCLKASYLIRSVEVSMVVAEEAAKLAFFLRTHCLSFECEDALLAELARNHSLKQRSVIASFLFFCYIHRGVN